MPTYRRPALLRRCLRALASQDIDPGCFEVLVVDDGSQDRTAAVLHEESNRCANLRPVVLTENSGPATARNKGVENAKGKFVLFLDDDVVASPSLVSAHLRCHANSDDGRQAILGLLRWHPDLRVTPFMRWLDQSGLQFDYDTWLREGPVDPPYAAFYTANLSLHRRLVEAAGGFDERFPYANYEDIELGWRLTRLGLRLHYEPSALAWHARQIKLRAFCRRMTHEAESAKVLRQVAPDLDIDTDGRGGEPVGRLTRLALLMAAPWASRADRQRVLERHYRAEIAVAYAKGARS